MHNVTKVILVGHSNVGKTSIMNRFIYNTFGPYHHPTIGASFYGRKIKHLDHEITINYWDCCGSSRMSDLTPLFFKNAKIAMIVYDVTNAESLEHALMQVKQVREQLENIVIILVGNKTDLTRVIVYDDVMRIAKQLQFHYRECSAATSAGIKELFEFVDEQVIIKYRPIIIRPNVILHSKAIIEDQCC